MEANRSQREPLRFARRRPSFAWSVLSRPAAVARAEVSGDDLRNGVVVEPATWDRRPDDAGRERDYLFAGFDGFGIGELRCASQDRSLPATAGHPYVESSAGTMRAGARSPRVWYGSTRVESAVRSGYLLSHARTVLPSVLSSNDSV